VAWSSDDVVRVLVLAGFRFKRHGKGSHDVYDRPGHKRPPSVPMKQRHLPIGTVRNILVHQAGLTMAEAEKLRHEG
jgi:predicted RNA binding protein YcfA (HicA-like mRNA interferase family)